MNFSDFLRWFGGIEDDRPQKSKDLLVIKWPLANQTTLETSEEDVDVHKKVEHKVFTSFDSMLMVVDVAPKVLTRFECTFHSHSF